MKTQSTPSMLSIAFTGIGVFLFFSAVIMVIYGLEGPPHKDLKEARDADRVGRPFSGRIPGIIFETQDGRVFRLDKSLTNWVELVPITK